MFEFYTSLEFEELNGILFFGIIFSILIFIFIEALKKFFDRSIGV